MSVIKITEDKTSIKVLNHSLAESVLLALDNMTHEKKPSLDVIKRLASLQYTFRLNMTPDDTKFVVDIDHIPTLLAHIDEQIEVWEDNIQPMIKDHAYQPMINLVHDIQRLNHMKSTLREHAELAVEDKDKAA